MRATKHQLCLLLALLCTLCAAAQPEVVDRDKYRFVQFSKNRLYIADSLRMERLYAKLQRLLVSGDEQLNIVHIGDSHLQADLFSNRVRMQMQNFFPGGNGGRGFVFPYTMARTNNPWNYKVSYTGEWRGCRNIQNGQNCLLGLAGISVTTTDSLTTLNISPSTNNEIKYDYTHIKVFYADTARAYSVKLDNADVREIRPMDKPVGVVEWELAPTQEARLVIRRTGAAGNAFTLYGVEVGTDDPGIIYHSIGVNGATVSAYLKCQLLEEQLHELNPDLIILSLGTNDAYVPNFPDSIFTRNLRTLLTRIESLNPETPIVLTTPADCYRGHAPNANNLRAREAIYNTAKAHKLAVWDFFEVMGGLGSVQKWHSRGLTAPDRVHLSATGYELQGDLFFEALIQAYDTYIERHNQR